MIMSLSLDGVTLHQRLVNISLDVSSGQFVHILGPNGAGKSSLLSVISGLIKPDSGEVLVGTRSLGDIDLMELSSFRALLEQSHHSTFSLTVQESLSFYQTFTELPEHLELALEINQFLPRPINTLSGGERQRVHIARTLMPVWSAIEKGNALVLFDEPFQGLDFKHQHLLCRLLKTTALNGNLVIVSQHDLNLCERYADSVWLLQQGMIKASGDTQSVLVPQTIEAIFDCSIDLSIDAEGRRYFASSL